ncbi:GH25 family lysozyme [Clostridium sp.]|uniref:GH25 family lysozyme n=1 Tax=Clostridium sp. TaxID=1506 RepID=UPI0026396A72|nr:GH25 family lysozyme [Clostridium sp.]
MICIKGIDISNNDGAIDFSKVAEDGVKYVYVKATEGQSFKDSYMDTFFNDCKANGLKVGAYHFLVGTSTPEVQAANFYSKIKDYDWDLVPMMDIETNFEGLSDYVVRFINAFNSLSPLKLGVYSYTSFIDYISSIEDTIKDMPFWEANYNNDPWNLYNNFFTNRIGHQYTETGSISGVNCNCDVNSFTEGVLINGSTIPGSWIENKPTGKWWYKHDDGSFTKDGWELINGKWYMFDSEGWMIYDWKKDGNSWYYMGNNDDGAMKTGWVLLDSKWYYFNENGAMQTGWQEINNEWYYLDHSGAMQTGWIHDDGKDYCLYSSGQMIHDCNMYGYNFDEHGVATKLS